MTPEPALDRSAWRCSASA